MKDGAVVLLVYLALETLQVGMILNNFLSYDNIDPTIGWQAVNNSDEIKSYFAFYGIDLLTILLIRLNSVQPRISTGALVIAGTTYN